MKGRPGRLFSSLGRKTSMKSSKSNRDASIKSFEKVYIVFKSSPPLSLSLLLTLFLGELISTLVFLIGTFFVYTSTHRLSYIYLHFIPYNQINNNLFLSYYTCIMLLSLDQIKEFISCSRATSKNTQHTTCSSRASRFLCCSSKLIYERLQ